MGILYATREDVMRAVDSKETARNAGQIDRALEAASRSIEGLCHRRFYPEIATRYFDWPNPQHAAPWRLWLDASELISVSAVSSGGTTISTADVLLEPNEYGPPYNRLELNIGSDAAFGGGPTHQRDITITGLYGYRNDETTAGDLDGSITSSATTLDVTAAPAIGVGSLLRIGTERLTVTAKTMRSTFVTTTVALISKASDDVLTGVSAGFAVGEVILIDGERMLVVDQSPTSLIVKRGWDGSTLATHSLGATIYAHRTLTVTRGVLGTTAASHTSGDDVYQWEPPAPVRTLAIAEAVSTLTQEHSSYSVMLRSGESGGERTRDLRGVAALRQQVYDSHGRKGRVRGV